MLEKTTVLYIENNTSDSEEVIFSLSKKVKKVHVAFNEQESLELFQKYKPDIIIADLEMPESTSLNVLKKIKEESVNTPVIVASVFSETGRLFQAIELGIDSYLIKPLNLKVLFDRIESLTKSIFLEKELARKQSLEKKVKELRDENNRYKKLLEEQNLLLSLFEKGESVLFKWRNDENWTVEYVSSNIETLLPGSLSDLNSGLVQYASFMNQDDIDDMMDVVEREMAEKLDLFSPKEYRISTSENDIKWVIEHTVTQKDSDGNIDYFIGSVLDITDKKIAEKKLEYYLDIINEHVATVSTDINGVIVDVSSAFCRLSGYEKDELVGQPDKVIRPSDPSTIEGVKHKDLLNIIDNDEIYHGELRNTKKDGSTFWVSLKVLPIEDQNNVKTGYLLIKHDITDKKIIEELSITDDLTKLYNRRYFNEVFQKEIHRAKRDQKYIVFMMLDVDKFKLYNDTYGHQSGDNVLIEVAKVLKEFTNRAGDYAFRLGGEEFGIIVSFEDKVKIKKYALNLVKSIESLRIAHEKNTASKHVTVSAGVAIKDCNSDLTVHELYQRADNALYKAKGNGRNQVTFY